jgi:tripartite-type tricarboxylate transporter receptor subunit TctC
MRARLLALADWGTISRRSFAFGTSTPWAPSKTPSDLIARINGDVARSFASPELLAKTEALGFEALASSPETAMQELRAYSTKWGQLVKERNIKVE